MKKNIVQNKSQREVTNTQNVYAYIAIRVGHSAYYIMSRDHGLSQK